MSRITACVLCGGGWLETILDMGEMPLPNRLPLPSDPPPDCIVCCEVLEHIGDPSALLAHLWRVIQPGGCLIVTCAGPGRLPHSGIDGGPLRSGEPYENVDATILRGWLVAARFLHVVITDGPGELDALADPSQPGDLYAHAWRGEAGA